MPYKKVLQKKPHLEPGVWDYLNDRIDLDKDDYPFEVFLLSGDEKEERELWNQYKDEILASWIETKPGTRPTLWWEYSAPRQAPIGNGWFYDGKLQEPRKRIGGKGTAPWDAGKAVIPYYYKGVPNADSWLDLDPDDSPLFESEASYLQRHGLLTKEEEKLLSEANGDFKPQTLFEILGEE